MILGIMDLETKSKVYKLKFKILLNFLMFLNLLNNYHKSCDNNKL